MAELASFAMNGSAWLRRHGVQGDATVALTPTGLRITGAKGGVLPIYAAQVERLRSHWSKSKYTTFLETHIWLQGQAKPLKLTTTGCGPMHAYAAVARGFGAKVAKNHPERLWRGSSRIAALAMAILMGILFLVAAAIGLFVLKDDEWWQRAVPAVVPALLTAVGVWVAYVMWPRPVRDLAEFQAQVLPDFTRRKLSNFR